MPNKPLPEIVCQKCNIKQTFRGQVDCTSCGQRLNSWSVASQIAVKGQAQHVNAQN